MKYFLGETEGTPNGFVLQDIGKAGMRNEVKMNFCSQAKFRMNTFRLGYLLFPDFIKISDKGIMQYFLKLSTEKCV